VNHFDVRPDSLVQAALATVAGSSPGAIDYRRSTFFCAEAFLKQFNARRKEPIHFFKMSLEEKLDKIRSPKLQNQHQVIPNSPNSEQLPNFY
jgi:hypothetical protein